MMGRGKRRCIRGVTSSWPAAAAFQAAVVSILPPFCQPSPNCASLQHHAVGMSCGKEGRRQCSEAAPVVTAGAGTYASLAPSAGLRVPGHGSQSTASKTASRATPFSSGLSEGA